MSEKFKGFLRACKDDASLYDAYKKSPLDAMKEYGLDESDVPASLRRRLSGSEPVHATKLPEDLKVFFSKCHKNRELRKSFMLDPAATLKANGIDASKLPAEFADKFSAGGTATSVAVSVAINIAVSAAAYFL